MDGRFTCPQGLTSALGDHGEGTLYLDNVDALDPELQELVAPEPRSDCRIMAGTGADLAVAAHRGTFSSHVFYRLNVIHLRIDQGVPEQGESA